PSSRVAGVAVRHPEAAAGLSSREQLARSCAVECRVSEDHVLVGGASVSSGSEWPDADRSAGETLSDVVVRLALEIQQHPPSSEGSETLSRAAQEPELE